MRTVGVKLIADVADYTAKLKGAGRTTQDFVGNLDKAARGGQLDAVADRAGVAGLALVGMAGYAVKAAADFDKSMSAVSAATHASTSDLEQLRKAALQAGKDTSFSATEAADGITELSKAGVSTADVLKGGLRGALSLAAAGQISVAEAAETAASAMTQFKLKGDKIPHVADLLAAGAGKAQGSVHDMGAALNQSGLVAAQFGLSIEDTTGALAEFASAGLIGSDAGTSLKTMLLAIANPSAQTRELMDDLGISFHDAAGQFVGFNGVAQVLQTRLKDLTQEQRNQALGQIFGNDAIRAASILYTDGAAGVEKWKNAVNDSGYAADTAAKLTDNLAGDIDRLKGSLETLAIQAGSGGNGGLRLLVQGLNGVVDAISDLPPVVTSAGVVIAGLAGGALLLGSGWIRVKKSTAEVRAELEALGPAGEKTAAGMSKLASAAGKVGVVVAVLETAGAIIGTFQKDLNPQVEALAVGLQRYAETGKTAGEASRVLGGDLKDLKVGFRFLADEDNSRSAAVRHLQDGLEGLVPGLEGTSTSLTRTRERITAMDSAIAQLVQGGKATEAQEIFTALGKELAVSGVSMQEFRKQFPQYAAALEVAGSATSDAASKTGDLNSALKLGADAQDKYKTATDSAAGAARGEAAALSSLSNQLKAQTDPVFGLLNAERSLTEAQKAAAQAVRDHGRNSDEAREATRRLASAAIELTGAAGALGNQFNGQMSPALRQTLRNAGLTKDQIADLAAQFRQAKRDGDAFSKTYEQKVITTYITRNKNYAGNSVTGARAEGGPVRKGASYLVGEKRPEVFVPNVDGKIIPSVSQFAAMPRGDVNTSRLMPSMRSSSTTTVIEHRVTFDGAQGEFGQMVLKAIRTSSGVAETLKQRLGI